VAHWKWVNWSAGVERVEWTIRVYHVWHGGYSCRILTWLGGRWAGCDHNWIHAVCSEELGRMGNRRVKRAKMRNIVKVIEGGGYLVRSRASRRYSWLELGVWVSLCKQYGSQH
jgi:hypothetical protein